MEKIKVSSVNCQACGKENLSYQCREISVNRKLMKLCSGCAAKSDAWEHFKTAAVELNLLYRFGQLNEAPDQMTNGPNVEIQPMEGTIQKAVKLLQRMDPNYFIGVKKIEVGSESNYGHVESKNPTIIHVNLQKIIQEAGGKAEGREATISSAVSIAHEASHVKSYNQEQGFVGGESVAQAEEQKIMNWIKLNENRLQDLFM